MTKTLRESSISKKRDKFIGQKFGRLTILEFSHMAHNHVTCWKCICECGTVGVFRRDALTKGSTRSCGCLSKDLLSVRMKGNTLRRKGQGESGFTVLINSYRKSAEHRGIEFDNSPEFREEIRRITKLNCRYCGIAPSQIKRVDLESYITDEAIKNSEYVYNGLDRIDSSVGYVFGNIAPCCYQCNKAKSDYSVEDFTKWLTRTYNHFAKTTP